MKKIIFIVGLPASGKTTLAETMAKDLQAALVDDPKSLDQIMEALSNDTVIVTDPFLCYKKNQEKAKEIFSSLAEVNFIYFENDLLQCKKNAKLRPEKKVDVEIYSKNYFIPEGASTLSVYRG